VQSRTRTIVDLTTVDLGRNVGLILDVARQSRARDRRDGRVVDAAALLSTPTIIDHVAKLLVRDITPGIGASGVKAVNIKCATDTAGGTPVIENILRASRLGAENDWRADLHTHLGGRPRQRRAVGAHRRSPQHEPAPGIACRDARSPQESSHKRPTAKGRKPPPQDSPPAISHNGLQAILSSR
jgi:hypothetical protein